MKKFASAAMMLASMGALSAMAEDMTGFIGDSQCKHSGATAKDAACSKACVQKKGADPVFVSEGKVLKFDAASMDKAKAMAGEHVTIDGTVSGDTVTVNSIKKAS
jgi:predicted metallopeptidase